MVGILFVLFVVVPILEIYIILQVGNAIGGISTLMVIVVMAIVGAALAKRQGLLAVRNIQMAVATGQAIGQPMVATVLVFVAAVLMLTPGFVTDAVGFSLLVPPIRVWIAQKIIVSLKARGVLVSPMAARPKEDPSDIIDV